MSRASRGSLPQRHGAVVAGAVVGLVLLVTSCSNDPAVDGAQADVPSEGPPVPALVGTWERETRCEEVVAALSEAGLEGWIVDAVAGNGFIPGVTSPDGIADADDPCRGAVPRVHSHFFTEDGRFGSLDWNGEPVDDGTYEITEDGTFVVSKEFPDVTFGYTIEGDSITFDPVIPDCAPDCFEAAWSVMVAYPGETWQRAD